MRKSKDIKRKRKEAGLAYRRGQRKEAYDMWRSAAQELAELRGKNKPAAAAAGEEAAAE
ncbi:MAG: hypothetical protein H6818_09235 [Phycisphaerales bacterium]|nr:hypothetical protein [Phycisphaerales bacterium]MCB9864900.1 hypothetical protein [Phycisphaerales bacterium]